MGNLVTPLAPAALPNSDNLSSDESSTGCYEIDSTTFQSYSYYGNIFKYGNDESIYHCLKYTIDHIFAMRPFEQWSSIRILDLRRQKLTGLYDLSTILPYLDTLILGDNLIQEVSGLPTSIQTLIINKNRLTDINGITPLVNLRYLDICNNAISSFKGLETLLDLKELHAENNKVHSWTPFQFMHGLKYLNLRGNRLGNFIFGDSTQLDNLEILDVSYNRIGDLEFANELNELRILKIEHNELESLIVNKPMVKLTTLYICFNRLTVFDGSFFPGLRTLHADDNHISRLLIMDSLPGLTEVSLRDQCGQFGEIDLRAFAGVQTLLLSGNPLRRMDDFVNFSGLEYLELCSMGLEKLPHDFAQQAPNLTVVCLDHNYLSSVAPLRQLGKLQKLVIVNNQLNNLNRLVKCLRSMNTLRYVDLRDNPISYKYYPTTTMDSGTRKQPCQCAVNPQTMDQYQKDDAYLEQEISPIWLRRRSIYRAIIIKSCPNLAFMDGVPISSEERVQAPGIVSRHYQ